MTISDLIKDHYNLNVTEYESLEGYDSTNFGIKTSTGRYVLKQYQYTEAIYKDVLAENRIIIQFSKLNYHFPTPIKSISGKELVIIDGKINRLLSFVEGEFLGDISHTPECLESIGAFLGSMNQLMLTKKDNDIAARELNWDIQYFLNNKEYLNHIDNQADQTLAAYFFHQFEEQVLPIQHKLRKCIIHSDFNHWNVLTHNGKATGIIDFGDLCYSYLINDLAIALSYCLMEKEDPLAWINPIVTTYSALSKPEEQELEILYYLIAARLCTSVCNSAKSKQEKPDSEYITISEKPAWDLLRKWITINPLKAEDCFRRACGYPSKLKTDEQESLAKRHRHVSKALSLSYKQPIEMTRSALQYMYDAQGNTYLDAYNNIMIVGHSHPKVIKAGQQTYARLNTNTRYLYDELNDYAELLLKKFPEQLNRVFFVNSGSAASDLAIRIALTHTNKKGIMVVEHGYHGNTRMGIDISHYKYNHKGGKGKSEYIIESVLPDTFNGEFKQNDGTAGKQYAEQTIKKIATHKNEMACFIAEPIVGCGGQVPLAKDYLKNVYPEIRKQGGVCISDEVQVGFGRLGDYFWGYEMQEVIPDIVILGKPMGNGHPLAAVVTTEEIAASFDNGMEFFSSFGGNPVSCAIGKAVLETIQEENLQQNAKETGAHLIALFKELQKEFPIIADIRGNGLFLGVEILDHEGQPGTAFAKAIANGLRERYILVSTDGPYDNVLKIKPPLCFNKENAETLIKNIKEILKTF